MPIDYGSIEHSKHDEAFREVNVSKPIKLTKGKALDVFFLGGDEDKETLERAAQSARDGNSVLVGTKDVVGRFLWPGAMEPDKSGTEG